MKILVVSGFLGAGKTTFIKEMLRKSGQKPVILENEYGQNNIDSRELSQNGPADLKMLEFMEGCVCCTQKDTFTNTLLTISAGLDPEYLVVEPTGVGRLSNITSNIQKISYDKISLVKSIVVVSPKSFYDNMAEFPEIYTDQIKHADIVVLSKIEHEAVEVINDAAAKIRAINPKAEITTQHYSEKDAGWWKQLFISRKETFNGTESVTGNTSYDTTTTEAVQVGTVSSDDPQTAASDSDIMSVDISDADLKRPAELIVFLEDVLRGTFGFITRAKGVLKIGDEWMRFDVADGLYAIVDEQSDSPVTQCVFFGKELDKAHLCERLCSTEPSYILNQNSRNRIRVRKTVF